MSRESTAATDRPARTSPWPLFVAVGLALSEVGVLFGMYSLTVGGVLLFGGSCAGMLVESDHAASTRTALMAIGGLFVLAGLACWLWGATPATSPLAVARAPATDGVARRGGAILAAGAILVTIGLLDPTSRWG